MTHHLRSAAAIIGCGETPVSRGKTERGEPRLTTEEYYAWAAELTLQSAGLTKADLDDQGLGIAGALTPHGEMWSAEIVHMLGLQPKLLYRADHGGMSAGALMVQGSLAIHAGLVDLFLCLGADAPMSAPSFAGTPASWERDYELPIGMMGPNSLFAFIMRRHMHQYGTTLEHTGKIAVTQRYHASLNPNAYLRKPLTLDEYRQARLIADPVRLLDAVIPVDGGLGFLLASPMKAKTLTERPVYLRGFGSVHNRYPGNINQPDITILGLADCARDAFALADIRHRDVDCFQPYDDYTIAVLMQLEDIGFCPKGEGGLFVAEHDLTITGDLPVNTGGGQISAGQPGMAAGFVNVVEGIRQLRGEGGQRQVPNARVAVATGIGGLAYGVNLINNAVLVLSTEA